MVVSLLARLVELEAEVSQGDEAGAQHHTPDEGSPVKLATAVASRRGGLGGGLSGGGGGLLCGAGGRG